MDGREDAGTKIVGENVRLTVGRQFLVERCHLRQATAKDNDLWVEQIDDAGQCPSEAPRVPVERCGTSAVAVFGLARNIDGGEADPGGKQMVSRQAGAR